VQRGALARVRRRTALHHPHRLPVAGAAARLHRRLVRRPSALHQVDPHRAAAAPAAGAGRRSADPRRQEAQADRRDRGLLVREGHARGRTAFADLLTACDTKTVTKVWADKGYTGTAPAEAAAKAGIDLDIVCGPKPTNGFVVQPRRWVVERTNGWINHHRRLVRQYETTLTAREGFLMLSQIGVLLRRLDRGQLFDTL